LGCRPCGLSKFFGCKENGCSFRYLFSGDIAEEAAATFARSQPVDAVDYLRVDTHGARHAPKADADKQVAQLGNPPGQRQAIIPLFQWTHFSRLFIHSIKLNLAGELPCIEFCGQPLSVNDRD
jgi:hypothetical protein